MNSYPENPNAAHELQSSSAADLAVSSPPESVPTPPRDPAWNMWDVLALSIVVVVAFLAFAFLLAAMVSGATFPEKLSKFASITELGLGAQALAELLLLGCMYLVVASRTGGAPFWKSVHWNWPANMGSYVLGGLVMQATFLVVERFLPFPKDTPFDAALRRPFSIAAITLFSVTLGPLMEELFFRGFLYPVLKRSLGVFAAIVGTALPFGLMHAAQYGYSWASVLLIFIVGVVLAVVREKKNSLGAAFVVHAAYNGTIILLLFIGTGGFRHLERIGSQ